MRTNLLSAMIFAAGLLSFTSCGDKVTEGNKQPETPISEEQIFFGANKDTIGNGKQDFKIKENHTIKKGTYYLSGWVRIQDGATLTIEPGTIIKGDKKTKAALIAEMGGKLIAKGTPDMPIVFTSAQPAGKRKPGDWGGIILCGKAKTNGTNLTIEGGVASNYGGTDDNDNSGKLSYVRCEFAGYPFDVDKEINGITLGAVGKGTQIDHVQVSFSNDDSFEWFGGCVDAKYLVAYNGWDDDFDTDYGYSGKLQYLLAVKDPKIADNSYSNSFESDNNPEGVSSDLFTSCTFSNVTMVGPIGQDPNFVNNTTYINGDKMNPNNGSKLGVFQAAVQIRRSSRLNLFNSVAVGFPVGLMIDNQLGTSQKWATEGKLKVQNNYFAGMGVLGCDINKKTDDHLSTNGTTITDPTKPSFSSTYFNMSENKNMMVAAADLKLSSKWAPMAGSALLGKASFTDPLLAAGFDKVTYAGAFASDSDKDNWTKGWTNFDPQNTKY